MGDDELVISRILVRWQFLGELAQSKCREDGGNVGIVREIEVKALIYWEGLGVPIQGGVDLRPRVTESVIFKAGNDFLLIPKTYSSLRLLVKNIRTLAAWSDSYTYSCRAVKRTPSRECQVDGVLKMLPFLICEEIAKPAEAVCYSLVGAHGLRSVDIVNSPLEALGHGIEAVGGYHRQCGQIPKGLWDQPFWRYL